MTNGSGVRSIHVWCVACACALASGGCAPADGTATIGRDVELTVDIGQAVNDVAFWTGTPPDNLLVVIDRGTRGDIERMLGLPSENTITPPPRGTVTIRGVVEPLPYPEATLSWNLTNHDAALVAERGVYVRAYDIVSRAPEVPGEYAPENIEEWGRETAPPPGEQNQTPLGLPPPQP